MSSENETDNGAHERDDGTMLLSCGLVAIGVFALVVGGGSFSWALAVEGPNPTATTTGVLSFAVAIGAALIHKTYFDKDSDSQG